MYLLKTILEMKADSENGVNVLELRKSAGLPYDEFNRELLRMSRAGIFHITETGDDVFVSVAQNYPVEALQKKWGGKRQGSGRPQTFPDERREILVGVRLPRWILDWLADQPNKGRIIEKALIETYQITRKGDDDAIR